MSRLPFTLERTAKDTKARACRFTTLHGEVQTPVFMPVGTQATVKSMTVDRLKETGSSVLLANTYHLLLRPGPEVFERFGGIHNFMKWDRPVLTDSGGFQIFSLPHSRAMTEEGASFQSYVDGRTYLLSPETSIGMQRSIGSDIMMVLDQCIPSTAPYAQAETAMHLTHRWARRSLDARGDSKQALFGIVQGACHQDLRIKSAEYLRELPFDGMAIGGLAVGETQDERYRFTDLATDHLPADKPRYLMGVGTPLDILEAVHRGVDMFDCIIPSQVAQRGVAYTSHGRIQMRRSVHKFSEEKLDHACTCDTCMRYSRAYLHHLVKAEEPLGWQLLTHHNIHFYHTLMREMRARIFDGTFAEYHSIMRPLLTRTDEDNPSNPPKPPRLRRPPRLGDYEIYLNATGQNTIRQISSGEVMHSVNPPEEEARRVYIEQSALAQRIRTADTTCQPGAPLVIWDVGLGAGFNAMAVITCHETLARERDQPLRPVNLISFERDLDAFRLTTRCQSHFPHVRHSAPRQLLETRNWSSAAGALTWQLLEGDFRSTYPKCAKPDIVFYDPFSSKTDSPLWTPELFGQLLAFFGDKPAELYTYSAATSVRVMLLTSGYSVAEGIATGPKASTTIAFSRLSEALKHPNCPSLLGEAWLERWKRSHARYPRDLPEVDHESFSSRLLSHPQFSHFRSTADGKHEK